MKHLNSPSMLRAGCVAAAALLTGLAFAANSSEAQRQAARQYQQERADCLAGRSAQDRPTCLKEAGAAYAEARRGRLDRGADARQLSENALLRCQAVPTEDRAACERMARGGGTVSGSVAEGAVLKELVTRRIEPAQAPASAASQ
ncbi:hypothetical protein G8A07_10745 [Roseateles sp. DAIF2]|uniref:hypothetical protein n=1 Tax=Roseateles sp. DAIF2 TaxID=2714952 RepID=UPI0018A2DB4B|nr:hypothetical protein [Roseateles sp. DAIF2]QPF73347.1 hypothetical protein G8A07_10745 [Roseateles sp. DAIF2]